MIKEIEATNENSRILSIYLQEQIRFTQEKNHNFAENLLCQIEMEDRS